MVFGNVDPGFEGLIASFDWVFIVFKFWFEEFVDIIFPAFSVFQSLCLSYILNSNLGSIQQPFLTIFHSVMLRFPMPITISFLVGPVPASNLCVCHLLHCIFSASLYEINPIFIFNHNCVNLIVGIVFK